MPQSSPPVVLSIAGYDPSSGAGITADIKTIAAHGCYAITCITALTIQSTQGVRAVEPVKAEVVRQTLEELACDFDIAAVRIGMLGFGEVARVVADFLDQAKLKNLVLDPVLKSTSGADLTSEIGVRVIRERLLGLVDVVTPNVEEAEALLGVQVRTPQQMHEAATKLRAMGARAVVITGGHLEHAIDVLNIDDKVEEFRSNKIHSHSTHGTGCAFASAIACDLATGKKVRDAVIEAKVFVQQSIERAYPVGKGIGPVNSLYRFASQG
jgi:hydroxymethylpyrimidine/phosphomethylpyrimidine kinase